MDELPEDLLQLLRGEGVLDTLEELHGSFLLLEGLGEAGLQGLPPVLVLLGRVHLGFQVG